MAILEGLVLSLADSQALVYHGIRLDTALVWVDRNGMEDVPDDTTPPNWIVDMKEDLLDDDGDPMYRFFPAPVLSELLDAIDPAESSAVKMTALAHALIALHEEK